MGTHKLTGLSVPSATGQSVRTTATITEANLEDAITKKHTSGSETLAGDVGGTVGANTVNKIKGHIVDEAAIADNKILVYKTTGDKFVYEVQAGGGVTTFLELTDTPASYAGKAGEILRVNATPNAVEFSGVGIETTLTVDSDTKVPTSKAVNDFCETTKNYAKSTMDEDIDLNEFNIFIDTNLISDHTYSGIVDYEPVGEVVVFGDLLYFHWFAKTWKKADADLADNMPGLRIALEDRTGGQNCKMLVMGYIRDNDWDFTVAMVYASATAGGVTSTAPSVAGQQLQRVGVAKTEDIFFFDPSIDVGEIKP
ncbi:hypothetical protein ES705_34794 [subsurface metagenome]